MILDALLAFDAYAGVAITVTRDSTNRLDMKNQRDMGVGDGVLAVLVQVIAAFTAGGAATMVTELKGAPEVAAAEGVYVTLAQTPAHAVANLTAGKQLLRTPLPLWNEVEGTSAVVPRYYKLTYTVATGPMLTGTIASYIISHTGRDANFAYPSGIPAQTYS